MLAKCANPVCHAPFLYLREGRLYQIETGAELARPPEQNNQPSSADERKPVRRLEFFWLCGSCSQQMTLVFDRGRGVVAVPLHIQSAVAS
jgi:hypothetical protein